MQLRLLGGDFLIRRDVVVLDHLPQHTIAGLERAVHVALGGGVAIGRANHSRQESYFAKTQFADILSEVSFRRFPESANRETAAIPEIHLIRIELENLALRKA